MAEKSDYMKLADALDELLNYECTTIESEAVRWQTAYSILAHMHNMLQMERLRMYAASVGLDIGGIN